MEDVKWKRDETPYLIFKCKKCQQFSYVKTTQKTKKCLRCGQLHRVSQILTDENIVNGMTNAVNRVKHMQNEFGFKKLKGEPDFISEGGFKIASSKSRIHNLGFPESKDDEEEQLYDSFIFMLKDLSKMYRTFPKYVIEIMSENENIPQSELTNLIRRALKEGRLTNHNGNYILKQI